MANNWAIAIGINQYQFFQPLGCAVADAEALKDFLVVEAGFLQQQCLVMTDTSPPLGDRSTYPTKENILLLLEDLAVACWQPQDRLWFFFSGYGVNHNGLDYLMPVEGNPDFVEETGLELRSLMQSLQVSGLDVLLLLDINRAFASQANVPVGQETIGLAEELQIPTILSCQPEQFSHESSELGHGFFTAALLEALRSGHGNTLADVERYLSLRTPELCQHYWRPTQNPITIIPSREQGTFPSSADNSDSLDTPISHSGEILTAAFSAPPQQVNLDQDYSALESVQDTDTQIRDKQPEEPPLATRVQTDVSNRLPSTQKTARANTSFWKPLLVWGTGIVLVLGLLVAVFLRNQASFRGFRVADIFPKATNNNVTDGSETEIVPIPPDTNNGDTTILNTLPPTPLAPTTQAPSPIAVDTESQQHKQALSDLEKMSLSKNQASDLSLAIAKARKIKPDEPQYEQAQTNIEIWSSMIFDLAENRAKEREYASAIAAAELIDQDQPINAKAQTAINQWRIEAKQYMANKTLLDAANRLIVPRQASTYNRAIEVAKKVPPGEPGYDDAQKSINQWSERIFNLAKRRAARGEIKAAIETANLVPEGTSAYNNTQEAIQKWQAQKAKK